MSLSEGMILEFSTLFCAVVLIAASLTELYFYLYYFRRILNPRNNPGNNSEKEQAVSVIVCIRNEHDNLRKLIPALLEQDYFSFEICLVADRSENETLDLLRDFAGKYPSIKLIEISETASGYSPKKYAIEMGIRSSAFSLLLFTDADCLPAGKTWIRQMAGKCSTDVDIVLGIGAYERRSGLLNQLIQYDTLITAAQFMGMALAGKPYMGLGRNLLYRKSLFVGSGGFAEQAGILAGDDDLFVNRVARAGRVAVCLHPGGFTVSVPEARWGNWFRQKFRHFSVGKYYRPADRYRIGFFQLSRSFIWSITIILAFQPFGIPLAVVLFLMRMSWLIPVNRGLSLLLDCGIPWMALPVFDFLHCISVFAIGLPARFLQPRRWK